MIKGIHHVAICVDDIKSATNFYLHTAQLEIENDADQLGLPILPGTSEATMLRGANARLRLIALNHLAVQTNGRAANTAEPMRPVSKAGITHFCLQAPEIKALYLQFAIAGATFHSDPVDLGTGFLYCYSRDLEANVVELEGVPRLWDDPRPWFAHVSLSTPDIERLSAFYSGVLEQPAIRSGPLGPNRRLDQVAGLHNVELKAAWIPAQNIQIEVMQYFQPPTTPKSLDERAWAELATQAGYCYICFEVTDAQNALDYLLSLGATQTPAMATLSGGHLAFCADPDGNLLLLLSLSSEAQSFSIAHLDDPFIGTRMTEMRQAQSLNQEQRKAS